MNLTARPRRSSIAAVFCACIALAACSDEAQVGEAPFTPSPPEVRTTPSTPDESPDAGPTVLTPPDEPPPPLTLTGEDFLAIRRNHEAYREWLYSHPAPEGLEAIYHPDCRCSAQEALLASYRDLGRWWVGRPAVIRSVEVVENADPDLVTLRTLIERSEEQQLIDAAGTIHQTLAPSVTVEDDVFVRADLAAPWLLLEFIEVDAPESSG